jgi:predicted TIM-barrel fold metal-dependent hydrolase
MHCTHKLVLLFSLAVFGQWSSAAPPIADVHVHFKWSQLEVTTAEQALAILDENNVQLAVVIGTPAELALQLAALRPDTILPVWSPYRAGRDWASWAHDPAVTDRARSALASHRYKGIGELHLIGGFAPKPDAVVIQGLLDLAAQYDVPVLLHTEFSRADYLLRLCEAHTETRILWAHAGAILDPTEVDRVLRACPNVWTELSARDPWRFVNNPITDAHGKLLPDWKVLIERWPDRFMVGSDPVWPVDQLDQWDKADTGWQEYSRFINFHQHWLSDIDPGIAKKIRLGNANRFFLKNAVSE